MLHKAMKGDVAIPIDELASKTDTRTRRTDYNYQHIRANKTHFANSFIVKTIPEWNNLPKEIKSASSVGAFKSRLAKLKKYIYNHFNPAHALLRNVIIERLLLCI